MASLLETSNASALQSGPRFNASFAFVALVIADIILKVAGFQHLHRIVKGWPVAKNKLKSSDETVAAVCETVDRATAIYLKHTWCLQRAAVTTCLLRAQGVPAQMVIGCRKMPFHGHAWVEVDGRVVNDNPMVHTFYCVLYRC